MTKTEQTGIFCIKAIYRYFNGIEGKNELEEGLTYEDVYRFSRFHKIDNLMFEILKEDLDDAFLERWKKKCLQNQAMAVFQGEEIENLCRIFAENKIHYLPLKGFYLRNLYPRPDLRFMSDIDVLIDEKKMRKVKKLMKKNGYEVESYNYYMHDEYAKKPFVKFEIHRSLVSRDSEYYGYYSDILERVKENPEQPFQHRLSLEDQYIFNLVHFYKHFTNSGSGIRYLIDSFLFERKYKDVIDRKYIDEELEKLCLKDFDEMMKEIVEEWFFQGKNGEKHHEEKRFILESGVYGRLSRQVEMRIEKSQGNVHKLLFRRLFPTVGKMKCIYNVLNRWIILLPFCYLHRLFLVFIAMFKKQDRIKSELKEIKKKDRERKKQEKE